MDVDLSKELMRPSKATLERQVQEARNVEAAAEQVFPSPFIKEQIEGKITTTM